MTFPNVLADRYASKEMVEIFDPQRRIRLEREFWIAVLESQRELGVEVGDDVIASYRAVVDNVNLNSIAERERVLRHDVKARLEEFNDLAGHQDAHKGLTSRDLTENVEQLVVWDALELVEKRTVALLVLLAELAAQHSGLAIVGRTHNVPAQPTTIGKRFAQIGEEILSAYESLQALRSGFAIRGIKGPVGSQQDQLDLLGDPAKVARLDQMIGSHLGIPGVLNAVGQVYPRSYDFRTVSVLMQLGSGPANLAQMIRLMAGHNLVTEGFKPGQVGSSAMPHKMNTRSSERMSGLYTLLRGYLTMAGNLAGDQWNEGDVSCSVVRRVVLPDSFLAFDGLYETTFSVLAGFGVFREVVANELRQYLPFLASTKLLLHAVRSGIGREDAHEIVKNHAVATALDMREGKGDGTMLVQRLAEDPAFPGSKAELETMVDDASALLGMIGSQVSNFCSKVEVIAATRSSDVSYRGAEIL